MKAFVESYEDGKSIIKICGEDDSVIERIEVSSIILESRIPVSYRMFPGVPMRVEITRN